MADTKTPEVCLRAEKISKIYPGTKALDQVSFNVYRGKVNVLIGENGAGKSTLMKIIAGIEQESEGELFMGKEKVHFDDVTEAREHGIGIIHQELNLFNDLRVYENLFIGREKTTRFGKLRKKEMIVTEYGGRMCASATSGRSTRISVRTAHASAIAPM